MDRTEGHGVAWLKATVANKSNGKVTLKSTMFDGTSFEFVVEEGTYDSFTEVPSLVKVGYVGDSSGFSEIILPSPALNHGFHIRVKPDTIVKWDIYRKIKGI